ncbi:MAG: TPM domain-containing protein [Alteraurantiacibacter sp.]
MIGQRLALLAAASALLASCASADAAAELPAGPVVDLADILPADEEALLDRHLRAYFRDYGTAIVVASVASLEGKTIEQVAFETFNTWGIGSSDDDRGLLILVAPNERKVRIEVGCGLESVITDEFAGIVIDDNILPQFLLGDFPGGIEAGVDALAEELADHPDAHALSPLCLDPERQAA